MSLTKNQKNQMTDRNWLFNRRRHNPKENLIKENKEELRQQINKQVMAYVNSGGQIQKCPPCSYSNGETEYLGRTHRRAFQGVK